MLAGSDAHSSARFWLDVADVIVKVIALAVGAAWTWMNYLRGRTYTRKLELGVTGKLFRKNEELYISLLCRLKNVGQSKSAINQVGTACEISAYEGTESELLRTYSVFEDHTFIEPGEQIEQPLLMKLIVKEEHLIGIRLNLRIVSGENEWNSSCFVEAPDSVMS